MKLSLVFLFISFAVSSAGNNQVFSYRPLKVELVGTLDLQTFPGPPNYFSIKDGDEVERHFYLKLDTPIDVLPQGKHPDMDNPDKEQNVKILQLSIGPEALWSSFRKVGEGGRVRIKGMLFHRFNGHHHSRVLLSVNGVETLEP